MRHRTLAATAAALLLLTAGARGATDEAAAVAADLSAAKHAFYSARYEDAAARAADTLERHPESLEAYDILTSALLFDLKRSLGDDHRGRKALDTCTDCQARLDRFFDQTQRGIELARTHLAADVSSDTALFFLAKLELNYLWMQNGVLGRRTGWKEYRESRRLLASLLERDADHVRGQVAMAWIDYIVDTRFPWGTKWLFGGGDRHRALEAMEKASESGASYYELVEARFGLWEMQLREGDLTSAQAVARGLAADFPDNAALTEFITQPDSLESAPSR